MLINNGTLIMQSLPYPFAYHSIIVDDKGNPTCFDHCLARCNSCYEITAYQDKPGFIATILRNITHYRESEQKLKASESLLYRDRMRKLARIIGTELELPNSELKRLDSLIMVR